jgi:hypothetical protein
MDAPVRTSWLQRADHRLAVALGERLASDVTVVERAAGWTLHHLDIASPTPRLLASHGGSLFARDLDHLGPCSGWRHVAAVAPPAVRALVALQPAGDAGWPTLAAWTRPGDWVQLALRRGIHHAAWLPDGSLVAGLHGRLVRDGGQQWSTALRYPGFGKPARCGVLADRQGRVWVAQYALNRDRSQAMHLWRSDDGGRTFAVARTWQPGTVRHLHFIQQDPYDGALWLGSGDRDSECGIWRSADGETWQQLGGGSQTWRAVALAFTPTSVVWGTDAGSDAAAFTNVAVRWDRASQTLHSGQALPGPVHGATAWLDGRVLLATGCEGGANEQDGRVHLWLGETDGTWRELASWRQGPQPRRVQYAVAHLLPGQDGQRDLWVQLRGVAAMPLGYVRLRLANGARLG